GGASGSAAMLPSRMGAARGAKRNAPMRPSARSALPLLSTDIASLAEHVREWDGPAVLPPRTAQRVSEGLRARGAHRHALQDRHRNRPHEGLAPVELVGLNRVAP